MPDFSGVAWPTDKHGLFLPIGPDGRPKAPDGSSKMRLPAFVIAAGVVGASVVAFLLPVHDQYGLACKSPGAVGAISEGSGDYSPTAIPPVEIPGVDTSGINANTQAVEAQVISTKVSTCHDGAQTRLIIAGAILAAAVIGSRFVPDVGQRER